MAGSNSQTPEGGSNRADEVRPRRGRGCGVLFFGLMLVLSAVWGAFLGAFVWVLDDAKTTIAQLDEFRPKIGTKVISSDGELLEEFAIETRRLVRLHEMPLHLLKAFIAAEDDRFYEHKGVRPESILRALADTVRTGRLHGGSTITQQIVRNVEVTGVSKERTLRRKLREAIIALQLEREYTKDEILELYLNQIFLGVNAYGVEAASQQYFGKSCRDLMLGESALLAGLARSPNVNQPFKHPENARKRRDVVLGQMLRNRFVAREEYLAARAASVAESVMPAEERAAARRGSVRASEHKAPYFVEEVRRFLFYDLHMDLEEVFEQGLEIQTTLDMRLQNVAERVLLSALERFDAQVLARLTEEGGEDAFGPVSGAVVCIDNRPGHRGAVRALIGGRDFTKEQFNTATQAWRQPGSSVKPFVWAAALDNGMTPSRIELDEPFEWYDPYRDEVWIPKNFTEEFLGQVTLRNALEKSINIISIRLVEQLGVPLVRSYMERAGLRMRGTAGLSIALGTPEVTVLDHCTAYSTFANAGVRYRPILVTEIRDRDGFVQFKSASERARAFPAFPEDIAYAMTYLMEGVAKWGTGSHSKALGRPRAGKTGTTNENRDAWFCGYTPYYTCVVWVGYRDNRPLGEGRDYTGGRIACPIWTEFMLKAHEGLPVREFKAPDGVAFYEVDKETGLAGGTFKEVFIRRTTPPTELPVYYPEEELAEFLEVQVFEAF